MNSRQPTAVQSAMLDALGNDVRYACRWLLRSPGFAAVAIASLGLGIGFNMAIFAVVDALLLRPLAVTQPERLVDIYTSGADGDTYSTNSLPDIQDYAARNTRLDGIAAYSPMFAAVDRGGRSRLVLGEVVTGNYFDVLGVRPALGRTIRPEDDAAGAARAVVLSYQYWQRELGGDAGVLKQSIRLRGQPYAVVGVLEAAFTGMVPLLAPEIWIATRYVEDVEPAGINESVPSPTGTSRIDRRGARWLFVKGRLKPGVAVEEAAAELGVIAAQLRADHPQTNRERRLTVRPASATRLHPDADGLLSWVVTGTMAAVGLVLLIACANVAGMLLARASARQREISLRMAIGAGPGRLVQQLLTESLVLGGLGAAVGTVLAWWVMQALATYELPIPIPLSLALRLDTRVLAFTAAATVVTGILAGLAPALRATRRNLVTDLKGGVAVERAGGRRWTARDVLVAGQIAVTALLLVVAGLLLRSLRASEAAELGFRSDGLAIVSANTGMLRYTPEQSRQFWIEAERRVRGIAGVSHVALASRLPFSLNFNRTNIAVPGHQKSADEMGSSISSATVSPEYFETLGVGLVEGRVFLASDTPDTRPVAIVSEAMARRYWPGESAIGKVVYQRMLTSGSSFDIVGVSADHKTQTVGESPLPVIYFAATQRPSAGYVMVARAAGEETALVARMRETLFALEPNLLLIESGTMRRQVAATLFPVRVATTLVSLFSALGLLLAAVGLYGVIAFTVARRTRDIGIRLAVGASRSQVLALVMRQGSTLALVGTLAGFVLAAAATKVIEGALYGVAVADPVTWSGAAVVLLTISAVANLLPAVRAMRIDPARALRAE
ncbi:MAG: ABC transporter permease [Vicinamibacterales bacterium]